MLYLHVFEGKMSCGVDFPACKGGCVVCSCRVCPETLLVLSGMTGGPVVELELNRLSE